MSRPDKIAVRKRLYPANPLPGRWQHCVCVFTLQDFVYSGFLSTLCVRCLPHVASYTRWNSSIQGQQVYSDRLSLSPVITFSKYKQTFFGTYTHGVCMSRFGCMTSSDHEKNTRPMQLGTAPHAHDAGPPGLNLLLATPLPRGCAHCDQLFCSSGMDADTAVQVSLGCAHLDGHTEALHGKRLI